MTATKTIRSGFSMIELLIVVAISMMLIAIAIPFVRPALRESKIREAARQVNTFLNGAKARAAETGRPFGVRLIRSSLDQHGDANDCYRLRYVEIPPYYSGDIEGALISVGGPTGTGPSGGPPPSGVFQFFASVPHPSSPLPDGARNLSLGNVPDEPPADPRFVEGRFVEIGDLIRFSYSGPWYRIDNIQRTDGHTGANDTVLALSSLQNPSTVTSGVGYQHWPPNPGAPGQTNSPFSQAQKLSYQIMRRPRPSGSVSIELPRDTSIDLSISGYGMGGGPPTYGVPTAQFGGIQFGAINAAETRPVDIIFSPSGQVEYISNHDIFLPAPPETIYLMVGESANVWPALPNTIVKAYGPPAFIGQNAIFPHDPDDFAGNIASNDVYWVSIQRATGNITTAENVGSPSNYSPIEIPPNSGNYIQRAHGYRIPDISLARDIVRSGIAKGSR